VTVPEISALAQMDTLAQEASEPLAAYYQRAVNILRRTHGRDRPRTTESTTSVLTGLEEFTLGCVVNAFVRGLYDPHLRRKVMNHGGASCPEPKKTMKARRARGTRAVRALREIIGREGMGPIDYK